jgi:hypothetical protein
MLEMTPALANNISEFLLRQSQIFNASSDAANWPSSLVA